MATNTYRTLGASNHTEKTREQYDYYATDPKAARLLLKVESFENILEPSCGEGHLSKVFIEAGLQTTSSDIVNRGYGAQMDFFGYKQWDGDIITNPPYKYAHQFIEHALKIIPDGRKVAMLLKILFLEGKKRQSLFKKSPPKTVYVSSSRILCAKNAEFELMRKGGGGTLAYAWFVWEKGYAGKPTIEWIN